MLIVGGFVSGIFFGPRNIGNIFEQATALGIVALGQMLVILTGGIDLSTGSVVSFATTFMSLALFGNTVGGMALSALAVIGISAVVGLGNGICVTKLKLPPFIVTLASMSIVTGIALIQRPQPGGSLSFDFMQILNGRIGIMPRATILWFALTALLFFILKYRRFGRDLYAVGGNENAATLSGVFVNKTKLKAYVLGSVFSAIGGIYLASRVGTGDATLGTYFSLDSITVCVLAGVSLAGGRGNIVGLIAATFILALINNILNLAGATSNIQYLVKGAILLATIIVFAVRELRTRREGLDNA